MIKETFGEYIRQQREVKGLTLRKLAALLDIDQSTLSKIERGERFAQRELVGSLAKIFEEDEKKLTKIFLSDKVVYPLLEEKDPEEILKVAEEKLNYLINKKYRQAEISFDEK